MSVHATITIKKDCADIDQGNDWIEEVKELLKGNVDGKFDSRLSNSNPSEQLTEEQESE